LAGQDGGQEKHDPAHPDLSKSREPVQERQPVASL